MDQSNMIKMLHIVHMEEYFQAQIIGQVILQVAHLIYKQAQC